MAKAIIERIETKGETYDSFIFHVRTSEEGRHEVKKLKKQHGEDRNFMCVDGNRYA